MRVAIISLLGVWATGLLLLLTPWAFAPSIDRLLAQVVLLGVIVCVCWAYFWLAPHHPRAALVVLRLALVYSVLMSCNAVLAF